MEKLNVVVCGEIISIKNTKNEHVIALEEKQELASLCVLKLKNYARKLIKNNNNKFEYSNSRKKTLTRFTKLHDVDFEYCLLASLLFAKEFLQIKEKAKKGKISFNHLSQESFWENNTPSEIDSVFFIYTLTNELYPQIKDFFEEYSLVCDRNQKPSTSIYQNLLDVLD